MFIITCVCVFLPYCSAETTTISFKKEENTTFSVHCSDYTSLSVKESVFNGLNTPLSVQTTVQCTLYHRTVYTHQCSDYASPLCLNYPSPQCSVSPLLSI